MFRCVWELRVDVLRLENGWIGGGLVGACTCFKKLNGAGKKSFIATHDITLNPPVFLVFVNTFWSIPSTPYAPDVTHICIHTHHTWISMTLHHPHTCPFFLFQGAHGESPESADLRRTWAWPNSFPWLWTWAHQLLIFWVLFLHFLSAAHAHLRPSQLLFALFHLFLFLIHKLLAFIRWPRSAN